MTNLRGKWYDAPDHIMCCICFGQFKLEELHLDKSDDKRVDLCENCWQCEEAVKNYILGG